MRMGCCSASDAKTHTLDIVSCFVRNAMSESTSTACARDVVTPPPVIDNKTALVKRLAQDLTEGGWAVRTTNAGVLQAVCQPTVSFLVLGQCLDACKASSNAFHIPVEAMISTIGGELVVSVRIGGKRQRQESIEKSMQSIEAIRDTIRATVAKLSNTEGGPSKAELERATVVLDNVVCVLTAVGGTEERAIQSYGIFLKKLAPSDPRNRIVIAFRIHAGTPVRITDLKQCLGECWVDGAITSADTVHGIDSVALPLTEEGALSLEHGNSPIMMVTSLTPPAA